MSSEKTPAQNISITGGQLSNVQIGGQAGRDLTIKSQQVSEGAPAESLSPTDIAALLDQLKTLLEDSALPESMKEKAVRNIEVTKDEVQQAEPDKDLAGKTLKRATDVLKEAGETVEAGTSLWEKMKPILETIGPWLGVTTGFFL